jgi:cholesterol transport system auxiliary component
MSRFELAWSALLVCALSSGCALTSKASAVQPRFFSPELDERAAASETTPDAAPLALRLGLVEAASHLEERMSYRVNASELGYYDDRRWSERPEAYLRRALEQELFQRRQIRRVLSGAGTTLDVELTAFEELRGPKPKVRLALAFRLHDDRQATLERNVVIERPLAPDGDIDHAQRVASALGSALAAAVTEVGDRATAHLRTLPRPTPATESAVPAREPSAPAPRSPSDSETR